MLRRAISIENFENDVYLISFGFLDFLCAILFFFLVCYPYSLSKSVYSYDVKVLRQSQNYDRQNQRNNLIKVMIHSGMTQHQLKLIYFPKN